jgi:hypothetical protein
MSDLTRRTFLGASAAAAGLAAAAADGRADIGAVNRPDPLLDGKELPTFRFALERSEGKVIGGNEAREATVKQLPISKGIAGVSMRLEPGGMRELHWHATAAEWAYVVEDGAGRRLSPWVGFGTNDFDRATSGTREGTAPLRAWQKALSLHPRSTTATRSSAPSASPTGRPHPEGLLAKNSGCWTAE